MENVQRIAAHTRARPALVLLVTSIGVLVAQIDTTAVNVAVRRIGADLGTSVSGMQWTVDAYNLVYATLLLTGGALGDLYGRRRIFACGIALFAVGSVACALAPDTATLLAGRALSGLGAALELPMSLALLALAYPERRSRQRALGIWASCNGLALVIGPTLGGLMVQTIGWRSIFYLVLPLCAAALALAPTAVPESSSPERRSLDVLGQAAAIAAVGGVAFMAIEGPHLGWTSTAVLIGACLALGGGIAFVRVERRTERGLVPFSLFAIRPFSASLAVAGLMTFGTYALLFLVPLYFQTVLGDDVSTAGVRLLPMSIAFAVVSQQSGRIVPTVGLRTAMTSGMAAMGLGELALALVSASTSEWLVAAALAVTGVGLGLNTAPVNAVAVGSVPNHRSGTASGLLNTARMIGATLGVAILGAVFAHYAGQSLSAAHFASGMRAALGLGGAAELAGAVVALKFIGGTAGEARRAESRRRFVEER
ncbi:MAG TPA: MFS transporter [Gammaproteobacteria bacterium]|nr:MFS transporter [Gammaproteobacteria bacterium]